MNIIRLSNSVVLEILSTEKAHDLNDDPKMYIYSFGNNKQIVMADGQPNDRAHGFIPTKDNILLTSTPHFYPDIDQPDYHINHEVGAVISEVSLPTVEFKQMRLHFANGFSYSDDQYGITCDVHCYVGGARISLASIFDVSSDSNISVNRNETLVDGQLFNLSLDFEMIDLDFLYNTESSVVAKIRQALVGDYRPKTLLVTHTVVKKSDITTFTGSDLNTYQRLSSGIIHEQQFNVTEVDNELTALVVNKDLYFETKLQHSRYLVESYLNTLKLDEQNYKCEHTYELDLYDEDDAFIGQQIFTASNTLMPFDEIAYRPIVSDVVDHFKFNLTIVVKNEQSGLRLTRTTSILVTDASMYKLTTPYTLDIPEQKIYNQITQNVTKVEMESETPKIIQIITPIFVHTQGSDQSINIFKGGFTVVELVYDFETSNIRNLYIKIGDVSIKNMDGELTKYKIPVNVYNSASKEYSLMTSDSQVIYTGKINRK